MIQITAWRLEHCQTQRFPLSLPFPFVIPIVNYATEDPYLNQFHQSVDTNQPVDDHDLDSGWMETQKRDDPIRRDDPIQRDGQRSCHGKSRDQGENG